MRMTSLRPWPGSFGFTNSVGVPRTVLRGANPRLRKSRAPTDSCKFDNAGQIVRWISSREGGGRCCANAHNLEETRTRLRTSYDLSGGEFRRSLSPFPAGLWRCDTKNGRLNANSSPNSWSFAPLHLLVGSPRLHRKSASLDTLERSSSRDKAVAQSWFVTGL